MAQISWSVNDTFTFGKESFGIVKSQDNAILITPGQGRGAKNISKGTIPADATPCGTGNFPYEVRFAFDAIKVALG